MELCPNVRRWNFGFAERTLPDFLFNFFNNNTTTKHNGTFANDPEQIVKGEYLKLATCNFCDVKSHFADWSANLR
jgi:hypothetical protein